MSKTLIWVLVGVLAVAGAAAVAFVGLRPHDAAVAPAASSAAAAGTIKAVPAKAVSAAAPVVAGPAAEAPATAAASSVASGASTTQPAAAAPVTLSTTPTIDELIQNAAAYEGMPVSLRGTILTQCTAGCEFALDDGTGALSVQLEGKGKDRLIPLNKVGKKIEVHGTFRASPRPQIVIEDPNGWQFVK
jgi:uncharacterized protein YdeI (BOF family)